MCAPHAGAECWAEIDRGLSYLCYKCGDYYCESCLRCADEEIECVSLRGIYGYAICPQCWERKK
jgi:hypothetical protein